MSFEKDFYKTDRIIIPQCKKCKFFDDEKIVCKKDNRLIDTNILLNSIKCAKNGL